MGIENADLHLQCLDFHICAQLQLSEAKSVRIIPTAILLLQSRKCEKRYLEIKISLLPLIYIAAQFK